MMRSVVTVEHDTEREARAGEPTGLEELYLSHTPAAFRLAYFLTGDRDRAEDLVHDAFVRVAGRFRHLRVPDAFDVYLRRAVVNLHTSGLRRKRHERAFLQREGPRLERAGDGEPEVHDDLFRALLALPERQRAAIVLRYYEDLSEREAAEILRCSTSALNALVARAMATLRGTLSREER